MFPENRTISIWILYEIWMLGKLRLSWIPKVFFETEWMNVTSRTASSSDKPKWVYVLNSLRNQYFWNCLITSERPWRWNFHFRVAKYWRGTKANDNWRTRRYRPVCRMLSKAVLKRTMFSLFTNEAWSANGAKGSKFRL